MRAIVNRLTYANVVATLALIVALGGGAAYAANTVFSSDIVNGEVKAVDIAPGAVRTGEILDDEVQNADIAAGAVRSAEIGNNQIRTPDVRELDGFFEASSDTGSCSSPTTTCRKAAPTRPSLWIDRASCSSTPPASGTRSTSTTWRGPAPSPITPPGRAESASSASTASASAPPRSTRSNPRRSRITRPARRWP